MSVCLPVGRSVAHPRRRIDDATIVAVVNAEELFVCSTPFLPFQLCHQHCSVTRKHRFALSFLLVVHIYLRARSLSGCHAFNNAVPQVLSYPNYYETRR